MDAVAVEEEREEAVDLRGMVDMLCEELVFAKDMRELLCVHVSVLMQFPCQR